MRKVGIYYAYWNDTWDSDCIPFISHVKKLGYDQMIINGHAIVNLSYEERKQLSLEAKKQGLTLSYEVGLTEDLDVSSPDERIRKKGIWYMEDLIKAIASMGGKTLGGLIYSSSYKKLPLHEKRVDYEKRALESMKEMVCVAQEYDVTLLCECVNRYEHFLLNTCQQGCAFVDAVNSPYCKLLLDTFHMNIEESSLSSAIRQADTRLGQLSVAENNRMPVGYGSMDWKEIKSALDDIKYRGSLVHVPFVRHGGKVAYDSSIWRDLVPEQDMDEVAQISCQFIKDYLV